MKETNIPYRYTAIPTNLFMCLDNNCRSTLFSLIQLSSVYATEDGWFFRTNSDLEAETHLSKNVLVGALDALFSIGVIEIIPQVKGSRESRKYRVRFDKFPDYERYSLEDCMKNPDYAIETCDYKHGAPSFQQLLQRTPTPQLPQLPQLQGSQPTLRKNDNYIDNIDNKTNTDNRIAIREPKSNPDSNPMSSEFDSNSISNSNRVSSVSNLSSPNGGSDKDATKKQLIPTPQGTHEKPSDSNSMKDAASAATPNASQDTSGYQPVPEEIMEPFRAAMYILRDYDLKHKPFDSISRKALEDATRLYMKYAGCDFSKAKDAVQCFRKQLVQEAKEDAEVEKVAAMLDDTPHLDTTPKQEPQTEEEQAISKIFIDESDLEGDSSLD